MTSNDLPLLGVKILVTRAPHQAKDFSEKLSALGAAVFQLPLVEFAPPDSWEELDQAINNLDQYDWIIFASSNAVRSFVDRLTERTGRPRPQGDSDLTNGGELPAPAMPAGSPRSQKDSDFTNGGKLHVPAESEPAIKPKIAVIGESTARAAQQAGLSVDFQPPSFIAEDFVANFPGYPNLSGTKILWPRTNVGRAYIEEKLTAAGASIDIVAAYKTILPKDPDTLLKELQDLIDNKKIDVITLASHQTAANLASLITDKNTLTSILIATIGPETSKGAKEYLGRVNLEAEPHTTDGMIQALITHFTKCIKAAPIE